MKTHWDGCWREPEHHECAVEYIGRLKMWLSGEEENSHGWMKKATELRFELAELKKTQSKVRAVLDEMLDAADNSEDGGYGTLCTSFVRSLVNDAMEALP
jgi:hypothetical protein